MIIPPFDPVAALLVGAFIAPQPQESAVAQVASNSFAQRMALLGHPGPFQSSASNPGLILDRDRHPIEHVMPTISGGPARREAAEITALALNRLCGFVAVEDKLDPEHINDVRAESARFRAQARPPEAAE